MGNKTKIFFFKSYKFAQNQNFRSNNRTDAISGFVITGFYCNLIYYKNNVSSVGVPPLDIKLISYFKQIKMIYCHFLNLIEININLLALKVH